MDMEDDCYLCFSSATAFKLQYLPSQMDVQFAILDTFRIFSTLLDVLPLLILMMWSTDGCNDGYPLRNLPTGKQLCLQKLAGIFDDFG